MKYRFLGTAAAEGIPAVFCNCPVCAAARAGEKGYTEKDVRTRSGSMINDDFLVDFSVDSNMHAIENNLAFGKIKHIAITHPHCDHLYPQEFNNRDGVGHGRNLLREELDVVCSERTKENLLKGLIRVGGRKTTVEKLQFQTPAPYESATVGPYVVTALPAEHMDYGAYIYTITDTRENKTAFHCNDTALPFCHIDRYDFISGTTEQYHCSTTPGLGIIGMRPYYERFLSR
jgi:phosphoribosyl 1,2-cyclic phosphate phosphodiesterase